MSVLAVDFDRLAWLYNSIEPFLWYGVAIGCWFGLPSNTSLRMRGLLISLLVVFGTSDFYETKAWWTPWWLFLWKAVTLLGLIAVVTVMVRRQKRQAA